MTDRSGYIKLIFIFNIVNTFIYHFTFYGKNGCFTIFLPCKYRIKNINKETSKPPCLSFIIISVSTFCYHGVRFRYEPENDPDSSDEKEWIFKVLQMTAMV